MRSHLAGSVWLTYWKRKDRVMIDRAVDIRQTDTVGRPGELPASAGARLRSYETSLP